MQSATSQSPAVKTLQDLDQAVRQYLSSNLSGLELFKQWQTIREASLQLNQTESALESENDCVEGDDSY